MTTSKYTKQTKHYLTWSVIVVLGLLLPTMAFAEAGKIIFLIGEAYVISQDEGAVKAKRGMALNSGDTIQTSAKGQLQIRMDDGGLIAIRPNSAFRIDEFINEGDENVDKTFFSLVKGGFRSVTGAIGHRNKAAYRVNTPIATIGIRGTDYTARLCESNCSSDDGLYIGVLSGGVRLSNDVGSVDIDPAEFGFVQDISTDPQLLDEAPGDVLFSQATTTTTSIASTDSKSTSSSTSSEQTVLSKTATTEDGSSVDLTTATSSEQLVAKQDTSNTDQTTIESSVSNTSSDDTLANDTTDQDQTVADNTTTQDPPPAPQMYRNVALAGTDLTPVGNSEVTENVIYATDDSLETIKLTNTSGSVHEYTKEAGVAAVDTGSTTNGEFSWGRWANMNLTITDDSGTNVVALTDANSLHWGVSNEHEADIVLPTSGSAIYQVVGGTSPTDNFGKTGSLINTASSMTIDFASQTGTFAALIYDLPDPDDNNVSYRWQLNYDLSLQANGQITGTLASATTPDAGFEHLSYISGSDIATGSAAGSFGGGNNAGATPTAALVGYQADVNYTSVYTTQSVDYQIRGIAASELQL